MIVRVWRGHAADARGADGYAEHLRDRVFPQLERIAGQRGAYLLRRDVQDGIEVLVVTLWDSYEAISRFAGDTPDVAVVEPPVARLLDLTDSHVSHFDVALAAGI